MIKNLGWSDSSKDWNLSFACENARFGKKGHMGVGKERKGEKERGKRRKGGKEDKDYIYINALSA